MSDDATRDDRAAMIADGRGRALEPGEAEDAVLLADLLADPSTWAEPRAGVEDEIVRSVLDAPRSRVKAVRRRPRLAIAAVSAAASIAIVVGVVATEGSTAADFSARLSATALAPAASASAGITHNRAGFRVHLDAHGLPRLGAGEYYEAWLKNSSGVGVPIGTFSSSDGSVTLWSGVSPAAFPTITVTREPIDNDEAASGHVVLRGRIHAR